MGVGLNTLCGWPISTFHCRSIIQIGFKYFKHKFDLKIIELIFCNKKQQSLDIKKAALEIKLESLNLQKTQLVSKNSSFDIINASLDNLFSRAQFLEKTITSKFNSIEEVITTISA